MAAESSGGREAREMPEAITLEEYKAADRAITVEEARRGFVIHAAVYVVVNLILVVWNVAFVPEYYWFPFPLVGWGIGLTMHYVFGVRQIHAQIEARQARIARRVAQDKSARGT
jgi:2TM domain